METKPDKWQQQNNAISKDENANVIQVIHEHLTVDKDVIETGKVYIKKRVVAEEATINIPLIQESYKIERVPVTNKIFDAPPGTFHAENGDMIIPVTREVVEVKIRFEVVEEIHVIKINTEVPHMQQITLLKENVEVQRIPSDK
ncbi:MAG: YsnF/AvaK domain-containing protein [Bacteroidota bacterium]|nr:YsnF/AvaK domain-containing protein [Bacteroidota bacterium]